MHQDPRFARRQPPVITVRHHSPDIHGGAGRYASEATSPSLLQRASARDPEAWERLADLYGPVVYRWCRVSGLQADDAADAVQEVFSAVAIHIATFRRDRPGDSFRGWLWRITRNKIHDHFRRRRGEPLALGGTDAQRRLAQIPDEPPDSSAGDPHRGDESGLEHRAVEWVRASVEERTWRAFWRVTVDGQPARVVADELGMSVRAVYDATYRVRRRIRRELSGLLE